MLILLGLGFVLWSILVFIRPNVSVNADTAECEVEIAKRSVRDYIWALVFCVVGIIIICVGL